MASFQVMYFSSSPHGTILPPFLPTLGERQDPPGGGGSLRLPLCPSAGRVGQTEPDRTADCHLQGEVEHQVPPLPPSHFSAKTFSCRILKAQFVSHLKQFMRISRLLGICVKEDKLYL